MRCKCVWVRVYGRVRVCVQMKEMCVDVSVVDEEEMCVDEGEICVG